MYTGLRLDCDLHHAPASEDVLLAYLPAGLQEFASAGGKGVMPQSIRSSFQNPIDPYDPATYPPSGPPGSDPASVASYLDANELAGAVLTYGQALFIDTNPNPYYAAAVAGACNDWTTDQWLSRDSRLYGSILVSNQLPDLAAKEIRRLAGDSRMKQVLMADNGLGKPFGHPAFDPIHAAAAECGLPLVLHAPSSGGVTPPPAAQGSINYYVEQYVLQPEAFMTHLASFITHGVFERYPRLRLLLVECGVHWLAPFLWRFDANYKGLRREIPWVRSLPSDTFRRNVRVSLNPLERLSAAEPWAQLLGSIGGDEILIYGSGYPRWDSLGVTDALAALPVSWLPRVMWGNAAELYGLEPTPRPATVASSNAG
jgi:uncharacterized protein